MAALEQAQRALSKAFLFGCEKLALFRTSLNKAATGLDALQIGVLAIVIFVVLKAVWNLLFQEEPLFKRLKKKVFSVVKQLPIIRGIVQGEVQKNLVGLEKSLVKPIAGVPVSKKLPEKALSTEEIKKRLLVLQTAGAPETRHNEGRVSGTIYVGGDKFKDLSKLTVDAYGMFTWTNPLHASVFPGVRQMDAEIVSMVCSLFGGDDEACGTVTSGGTESILLAMKAYRDWGAARGITQPNIVLCRTAHPAFDKAGQYFKIAMRRVDEDPKTRKAIPSRMARYIDSNTVALVGSCMQYPHGCTDPIPELGKLALANGIGLHVDSCLGSFLVPFLDEVRKELGMGGFPASDFRAPGVTSISADTHKFGMCPKGSSVIMYRNKQWRKYQYSVFADWPGGVYGTPGVAGSRPGALIAATWAAMMFHGVSGYRENCKKILQVTKTITDGLRNIKGIRLMCEPDASVIAFDSGDFDICCLCEPLIEKKGWDLNIIQFPVGIHLCVTMAHTAPGIAERFVKDVAECAAEFYGKPSTKPSGAGAMYGTSQAMPDRSLIEEMVAGALDCILKTERTLQNLDGADDKKKK